MAINAEKDKPLDKTGMGNLTAR